jgi:ATPase family associated with various cellular activities (AAA)/Winged helix domain, variant
MMGVALSTIERTGLAAEWERIGLLAHVVAESRQGRQTSQEEMQRLSRLQLQVESARRCERLWEKVAPAGICSLDLDVLACVLAPEAEPRLGWAFQSLQVGVTSPYPTPALLHELLAIVPDEVPLLYAALADTSPLRRNGLIEIEGSDPFHPVRPAPGVAARLLGRSLLAGDLPGAILVRSCDNWDGLVLPADRIVILKEFLLWITHKTTVVDKWGGRDCGGPVALFVGPSGTGKTLAAAVLANQLGWPLYRVDLGRMVSKYIGETEKNLNRLFDAAHCQPMILQFDEADSLFSKRGEIKEARDRYANMEVSHLLARIEAHQGPVILTTNLRKNLDQAFARRFQIVVDFPRPDAAARARLWRILFPVRAPLAPEVDTVFLGAAVNLSGGSIRNAALHAAYLAAEGGGPVNLPQVALAVWRELGKDGRELSLTDMGPLANFLPKESKC